MKSRFLLPCAAVICGVPAFVLRLLQNHTGFDQQGLPISGNLPALLLPVLLAALAALLLALTGTLPKDAEGRFPADFSAGGAGGLTLVIAGVFLMAVSGVFTLLGGIPTADAVSVPSLSAGSFFRVEPVLGLLSLVAAVSLFPAAVACRRSGMGFGGGLLLVPVVCMVARLVLVYRTLSTNPVLGSYYIELLSLVALVMAFYRLSAFGVGVGSTRRLAFWAAAAVVLALTLAADGLSISLVLHLGGAAAALGFLLLRLGSET